MIRSALEATAATCRAGVSAMAMMPYIVKYSCVRNVKSKNLARAPHAVSNVVDSSTSELDPNDTDSVAASDAVWCCINTDHAKVN